MYRYETFHPTNGYATPTVHYRLFFRERITSLTFKKKIYLKTTF